MNRFVILFFVFISIKNYAQATYPSILLYGNDAVIWNPEQEIKGEIIGISTEEVIAHHNNEVFSVAVDASGRFSFQRTLKKSNNKIWLEVPKDPNLLSDTLNYKLGYEPRPILKPWTVVKNGIAELRAEVIENPYYKQSLQYYWKEAEGNPAVSEIKNPDKPMATVRIPNDIGGYTYKLAAITGNDTTWFQTKIIRDKDSLYYFDIDKYSPTWMDNAVIYQITPASFVDNGTFQDITDKLEEIRKLGVNTIWLQPIFGTYAGGQGYDITNYLALNPNFGTDKQLKELIQKAKQLNLRVILDVVFNHSSINHPYAKDLIKNGKNSHYYDFYQHEDDGKAYSSLYTKDEHGFINYFWDDLVNLNYNNEEVQRWILEIAKYWLKEYDIDGYRLDAIWGLNSRNPEFAERLRTELKSINPEFLLLAEDKGSDPKVYELGFDAAYDWTRDTTWVSQWSWEYEYDEEESHTIFNHPDVEKRGQLLRKALFQNGGNNNRKLFYLENNDLPGFIRDNGLARTKMAAALLFSLPGIPMLYNGQEIGHKSHPYSTHQIFKRGESIRSLDQNNLFDFYKKIIGLHNTHPALRGGKMEELAVSPGETLVSFHRWKENEDFIIVVNLSEKPVKATIKLENKMNKLARKKGYVLKDVLGPESFDIKNDFSAVKIPMEGYSVRWLQLTQF
ncbi:alpha-amylase family glycosyl hydrolase [Zunongwangia pacifica]|uniref:DUF3459 domain-containing protein n=1 Tax=Zunongwangia pacifica TaxID=2911062 RepID=A0A9X2CM31_9FLAO|nr:alpha-amylase family glycosyl hydrolase [Zunongwangia pacifica]MCL6217034.1 DUF3459 domain-containing protein [Zunongwangia pacifica]